MQNCHTFTNIISVEWSSIRLEVNFGPKHQYYTVSTTLMDFDLSFYVSDMPDNNFVVFG